MRSRPLGAISCALAAKPLPPGEYLGTGCATKGVLTIQGRRTPQGSQSLLDPLAPQLADHILMKGGCRSGGFYGLRLSSPEITEKMFLVRLGLGQVHILAFLILAQPYFLFYRKPKYLQFK